MRIIRSALGTLHPAVRKSIIAVVGFGLIILGLVLIVLPGPFTIPPIIAGLAVLSTEFEWAHKHLHRMKEQAAQAKDVAVKAWKRNKK